jgi:hypothetical protein
MSTFAPHTVTLADRRARLVADAVVSAYVTEISRPLPRIVRAAPEEPRAAVAPGIATRSRRRESRRGSRASRRSASRSHGLVAG